LYTCSNYKYNGVEETVIVKTENLQTPDSYSLTSSIRAAFGASETSTELDRDSAPGSPHMNHMDAMGLNPDDQEPNGCGLQDHEGTQGEESGEEDTAMEIDLGNGQMYNSRVRRTLTWRGRQE